MAHLSLTLNEAVALLLRTGLPEEIRSIGAENDCIVVTVKYSRLVPALAVHLCVDRFEENTLVFKHDGNSVVRMLLDRVLPRLGEVCTLNGKELHLNINTWLVAEWGIRVVEMKRVSGVLNVDVVFEDAALYRG
jgi:hypothetical protein